MKNKTKENPIMHNKKVTAKNLGLSEDENEIKRFVIIVIAIAVIAGIVYIATEAFNKKEAEYEDTPTTGAINYDVVTIGTLLNRPSDDYYVLIYDSEKNDAVKYATLMDLYIDENSKEKNYKPIYLCDLSNSLNKEYYNVNNDNKSNPKATKIEELDLGDLTLIQVKKGKIVKYVEDYKTIHDLLR